MAETIGVLSILKGDLKDEVIRLWSLYLPENWVPHITLAMGDLTDENFERAKHDLMTFHPYFRQTISSIALVRFCRGTVRIELVRSWKCEGKGM